MHESYQFTPAECFIGSLTGKMATTTNGSTIPDMIAVSMTTTCAGEILTATTLTGAACIASSRHTVCTAPPVITADEAASAHGHSR